eukprot:Nitzschia sp. Nitz4//scaffold161_size51353//15398//16786//NITZ4_006944-RA/size51353-processed-gene-0.59-mRNA-1//1//CDS//3329537897//7149//frame0
MKYFGTYTTWLLLSCILVWNTGGYFQQVHASSSGSTIAQIPLPSRGVADPDEILNPVHRQALEDRIASLEVSVPSSKTSDETAPIQIAVVLIERMELDVSDGESVDEEFAAEQMARDLHDAWGVGHKTEKGGTGVLIFLSVYDRVVYISRGAALDRMLNNARTDAVIESMRPHMRQAKYAEGFLTAIDGILHCIEKGEPSWKETILDLFQISNLFILMWVGTFVHGLWKSRTRRQEQEAYARAASQLSEIDRAQAEALQGQYQATSCPICLEAFKSSTVGSDDQPIKLLRCGHVFDESCWSEWVSSGRGDITKCPIYKMDIGGTSTTMVQNNTSGATVRGATAETANAATTHVHNDMHEDPVDAAVQDYERERIVRRFQLERNFRLMQLATHFPNFITPTHINRWTSPSYNGQLAQDPAFRQLNPRVLHQQQLRQAGGGGGHSSSFGGFGGGVSSGGRSGRF